MRKQYLPEAIGIFISLSGVVVMASWYLDIGTLKSILPVWNSMKFSTAFLFFLSGIILYFIARSQKENRELAVVIIPVVSMVVFLLMVSLLASTLIGIDVGIENLFLKNSMGEVAIVTPGRPSVATMLNFIVMAMAGILAVMNVKRLTKVPAILGIVIVMIGSTAILGYIADQPLLYSVVLGVSGAMALHTAILFVLLGIGLVLAEKYK